MNTAPVTLAGAWEGFHTNLRTTATEEPLKIAMTFGGDGRFEAKNSTAEQTARGDYVDFQQSKKLVLDVTESDFPAFGLRGLQEFRYDVHQTELLLTSDFAMLKLKREDVRPKEETMNSTWQCEDLKGYTWTISMTGKDFWASITKGGSASILMKGTIEYLSQEDETVGELHVLEAQPAVDIGTLRFAKKETDGTATLTFAVFGKNGKPLKDLAAVDCSEK